MTQAMCVDEGARMVAVSDTVVYRESVALWVGRSDHGIHATV